MGERLMWTLFSAALLGAAALAADVLATEIWRRATGRDPPKGIWAVAPIGRKAGVSAAQRLARLPPLLH